jgi:hypothetical protein
MQTSYEIDDVIRNKLVKEIMERITEKSPEYKGAEEGVTGFFTGTDESSARKNFLFLLEKNNIAPSANDVSISLHGEDSDSAGLIFQWEMIIIFIPKTDNNSKILEGTIWWDPLTGGNMIYQFLPGNKVMIKAAGFGMMSGTWELSASGKYVVIETDNKYFKFSGLFYSNDSIVGEASGMSGETSKWEITKRQ